MTIIKTSNYTFTLVKKRGESIYAEYMLHDGTHPDDNQNHLNAITELCLQIENHKVISVPKTVYENAQLQRADIIQQLVDAREALLEYQNRHNLNQLIKENNELILANSDLQKEVKELQKEFEGISTNN